MREPMYLTAGRRWGGLGCRTPPSPCRGCRRTFGARGRPSASSGRGRDCVGSQCCSEPVFSLAAITLPARRSCRIGRNPSRACGTPPFPRSQRTVARESSAAVVQCPGPPTIRACSRQRGQYSTPGEPGVYPMDVTSSMCLPAVRAHSRGTSLDTDPYCRRPRRRKAWPATNHRNAFGVARRRRGGKREGCHREIPRDQA